MALPRIRDVADANFQRVRARQNRLFLHDVVLPHLESMPTPDDDVKPGGAVLNLNEYIKGVQTCPTNNKYSCGRTGCFAGWYVLVSDKYKRLSGSERSSLEDYEEEPLAEHFGIDEDLICDLFGPLGSGVEQGTDAHYDTREALALRAKKLKSLMRRKGDFRTARDSVS